MKKRLLILSIPISFLIILILILHFRLNYIVKKGIETFGPEMTGTDVRVEDVRLSLFSGSAELYGLVVGNPRGFDSGSAFRLGHVRAVIEPLSVFKDTVVVNEIYIDMPLIVYEKKGSGSNVDRITKNISRYTDKDSSGKKKKESQKKEGKEKRFIIERITVKDAKVSVMLFATKTDLTLRELKVKDVGKKEGGVKPSRASQIVMSAVIQEILKEIGTASVISEIRREFRF